MKRFIVVGIVALFVVAGASQAMAKGGVMIPDPNLGELISVGDQNDDPPGDPASDPSGPFGSAPQSGDGISDGSGLDSPNGPNTP